MDLFAKQTWENYDAAGLSRERLKTIEQLIPPGMQTVLDAGCGNGAITNALAQRYQVTGLDFSPAALEHVQTAKILASVTSIPCADHSFDLVMCNEVLEHLTDSELIQAIAELNRCAKTYLLLSVPNSEQLASGLVRCANCGYVFHAYGHLQSFDLARLDALTSLRRTDFRVLGPRQRSFHPALLRFRQHQLGQWFKPDFALSCPHCGGSEFLAKKSILTKTVNACGRLGRPSRPYWLMELYAVSENRKAAK